jgi:hypothetical protein
MTNPEIIKEVYDKFNARDIDAVLAFFTEDVDWPNGWEGGYVRGQDAVRHYWTRQWNEIDPTVTPVGITTLKDGRLQVDVRQVVKAKTGELLADSMVIHTYTFVEGLIDRMEISEAG